MNETQPAVSKSPEQPEPELTPLDVSGIKKILVVVAHPDDPEYGLSAAAHAWIKHADIEIAYLLLTSGEAGIATMTPEECGPLRAAEQREACNAIGVESLEILDFLDGQLVYGLELRKAIARKIRQFQPDAVVTLPMSLELSWGLNQADHRVAGLAALDAARDAANPWVFRELPEPAWSARQFWIVNDAAADHAYRVDCDDEQAAIASLECHKKYLAALEDHPPAKDFIPLVLRGEGLKESPRVKFKVYQL
ncbi:PIG-L family deacetylase [Corynebacterium pseudodiphtheriticum]|uniref:PIG-L deacetylase family protein n=1 Tax=Corynebacterium pseudodiphtheriticum TaxID=37637 RepID=UPI002550777C|nr:PIG-L family deacetylase [Corynebacterium pseudodiphtheriticum]MDK8479009.1 PIG-L family deacetylase [Corynebacterium pseudodiphtheriticum]MDK8486686.1 PIG-L family deacetylase [Corynebacterium pseudodiphtheriticum]MDK8493801.1 PIG-L family deacetylase [Corynebacterium pseudodiphtheriticum]MDK8545804.1 PIG-L family deacetylase [Corynebacterium pseudodiphtheriticum]MDK8551903.1 PIG-L family deacetylase [Corynebacterium pseudodiphtheriticum]